jgi:hypothetical protein
MTTLDRTTYPMTGFQRPALAVRALNTQSLPPGPLSKIAAKSTALASFLTSICVTSA